MSRRRGRRSLWVLSGLAFSGGLLACGDGRGGGAAPADRAAEESLEPQTALPDGGQVLELPVSFVSLEAPDLDAGTRTVDEDVASALLAHSNRVWGQCGVRFTPARYRTVAVASVARLRPSDEELLAEKRAMYAQIQKAFASSEYDGYFDLVTPLTAIPKKVAPLFGVDPDALGGDEAPILLMPDGRVLNERLSTSFVHPRLATDGLLDFYFNGSESLHFDGTRMITHGHDADPFFGQATEQAEVGEYTDVLAHELGHFLGLNHDYVATHNLMDGLRSNRLLDRQCVFARTFLETKLGRDPRSADGTWCRERLRERVCRLDSDGRGGDVPVCGVASGYTEQLLGLYDEYPERIKRLVCELEKVFIHDRSMGSAETVEVTGGGARRYAIYLRRELLDGFSTIADFLSWKEQLSFGGDPRPHARPRPELPRFTGRALQGTNAFLYQLFTHELGHVLALSQDLDERYAPLSWRVGSGPDPEPLPENEFPLRARMCFYSCQGRHLEASEAPAYYDALFATNFVSAYGALDSHEDFAETFVYHVLSRTKGATWTLRLPSGATYDPIAHFESERLRAKREFIEAALAR